jgi:hypothetical protein
MTLRDRLSRLEQAQGTGRFIYEFQTVVVHGDGPAPDFPPGDGRPQIRIIRRITSVLPEGATYADDEASFSAAPWYRRRWRG